MSDVLLTHGYFLYEDEKERQIMRPYPTLGLLYISAYLRKQGFEVDVFDSTFASRDEFVTRLEARRSSVLGVYTNLMTRGSVLDIIAKAREKGWTVIVGGPESANYPAEYLQHGADVVVVGEGELTMAELLPALSAHGPHRLHDIPGTVFKDETGRIVTNPARAQIEHLDSVPWPDRGQIDQQRYVDVWRAHHGSGSVNLITARGCPYKCSWCSHAVFGFTHRRRSYLDCANEVEWILQVYRPDQLWYADDVFTIHHGWLFYYAAELKRRGIRIPFETISRADRMMKEEVLETLAEMGCYRIWIGAESGSQRILDAMRRGVKVEQVHWATEAARRHGIQVGMFLMWGYDGEELQDIQATIEMVKKCSPDTFLTTVSYPIMNTEYFRKVSGLVTLNGTWAESTDRDYSIAKRLPKAYYEHADRWLKNEVAAHRLQKQDPAGSAELQRDADIAHAALLRWSSAEDVHCTEIHP
ncbi:MAG: B12-binding domain-containing radical SAM protein [Acidobacteriaceae bacterium]|nr:B12-binding domain-containing radical SAM protein [Acidobacteriaceae bacterium]